MPHINDRAAKDFQVALERMRLETVKRFIMFKDSVSAETLRQFISEGMENFVMNTLNFKGDINKLMVAYDDALKGISSFPTVNESTLEPTLRALRNINTASWITQSNIEIGAIQKEIFNASLTNQWNQKTIINNLQTGIHGNLSEGQLNTLIDTSLSVYERDVTSAMMAEMPEDTLYIYSGPLDEKTREICVQQIGAGELTESQIISTFGSDVLQVGGGFNCRHRWDLA